MEAQARMLGPSPTWHSHVVQVSLCSGNGEWAHLSPHCRQAFPGGTYQALSNPSHQFCFDFSSAHSTPQLDKSKFSPSSWKRSGNHSWNPPPRPQEKHARKFPLVTPAQCQELGFLQLASQRGTAALVWCPNRRPMRDTVFLNRGVLPELTWLQREEYSEARFQALPFNSGSVHTPPHYMHVSHELKARINSYIKN